MNRKERAKLKMVQRAEAARRDRIAEIKAGNAEVHITHNDPLADRRAALTKAPKSSHHEFTKKTYKKFQQSGLSLQDYVEEKA